MVVEKPEVTFEDRLIAMIAWMLNIPVSRINLYTDLRDDLYLDPIDKELLIAKLESQYQVYFSPEEANGIETVLDACSLLRKHAA